MKKNIANVITLCNLFCGVLSIWLATHHQMEAACIFVIVAAAFDFLDGFVARLLGVSSELGKQLDSLSDIVSFGVAPAVIVASLLQLSILENFSLPTNYMTFLVALCFINPMFAAYRLAKFNIDEAQSENFIGLPSPANGLFFISFAWWLVQHPSIYMWFSENFLMYYFLIFIFSFLMISPITMFSLKFKHYGWQGNQQKWILIGISIFSLIAFQIKGISMSIVAYILLSLFSFMFSTRK